jgi:clan AA aspartic protease (TIGR02281 family)
VAAGAAVLCAAAVCAQEKAGKPAPAGTPEAVIRAKGLANTVGTLYALPGETELVKAVEEAVRLGKAASGAVTGKIADEDAFEKVKAAAKAYLDRLAAARALADATRKRYEELAGDAELAAALGKVRGRLGPHGPFEAAAKTLAQMEAKAGDIRGPLAGLEERFRFEYVKLEKRREGLYAPVTINGDKRLVVCVDTGCTMVTLSSADAARCGIRVPADAEDGEAILADGKTRVRFKHFRIKSIAVGGFRVDDPEIGVMLPIYTEAESLLGMSFLERFKCEFDPAKGEIRIRKVVAAEPGAGGGPPGSPGSSGSSASDGSKTATPDQPARAPLPDGPPEKVLAAAGLSRFGVLYVLAGETELSEKLKAIAEVQSKAQSAVLRAVSDEAAFQAVREIAMRFLSAVAELRASADATSAAYAELAADPKVKAALAGVGDRFRLGPSAAFTSAIKRLREVEDAAASVRKALARIEDRFRVETVPLHIADKTIRLDVGVAVGKETKTLRMGLDTGAATCLIPAAECKRLGIAVPADAEVSTFLLADGRTEVNARIIKADLTVGGFTAKDVRIAVTPESLPDAEALLGCSFLDGFRYDIDPGNAKMKIRRAAPGEVRNGE